MWYYVENGQPAGPVSEEALLAELERLGFETLVWTSGMPEWTKASAAGLTPPQKAAPPPPPEPAPEPVTPPEEPLPDPVTVPMPAPSGEAGLAEWRLTGRSGPPTAMSFALEGRMTVGRSPQSDICISDDALSRNHAVIECGPEGCLLSDSGSTNGTFVNGVRISGEVSLSNGDVVVCGAGEFVVTGPSPVVEQHSDRTAVLSLKDRERLLRSAGQAAQAAAPAASESRAPASAPAPTPTPAPEPVAAAWICPHCGGALGGPARFCVFCGAALQ